MPLTPPPSNSNLKTEPKSLKILQETATEARRIAELLAQLPPEVGDSNLKSWYGHSVMHRDWFLSA